MCFEASSDIKYLSRAMEMREFFGLNHYTQNKEIHKWENATQEFSIFFFLVGGGDEVCPKLKTLPNNYHELGAKQEFYHFTFHCLPSC